MPLGNMHWDSMTKSARTPTYSREATRETSFHGLALPHFSGAFELFGHVSRRVMKRLWFLRGIRSCGRWGFAPTTTNAVLSSGQRAFFITLLVSRSGSSMRKSFALCEAFGLTPFPG